MLEVYLQAQGTSNGQSFTNYDSQGGANYRATFTIADEGQVADSTELLVLHQFYAATGGDQWSTHTNWPTSATEWSQATLAQAATWFGVSVTSHDVSVLNLPSNHLVGTMPAWANSPNSKP